jgi:hypothetical protein
MACIIIALTVDSGHRRTRKLDSQVQNWGWATELGRSTPAARAVTGQLIAQWQDAVRNGITRMQAGGQIAADIDASRTAAAIIAAIQGGVTILMATGSTDYLEAALDTSLAYLRR